MISRIRCVLAAGALAALAATTTTAAAAPVQPNTIFKAWVWANLPTAAGSYTPSAAFQSNYRIELSTSPPGSVYSTGTNTITRTAIGAYSVTFGGLASAGATVHVTAYGGSHHCKVAGWSPSGADMLVSVRCFTAAGVATDGMFTALIYKDGTKSDIYGNAYLWADQPSAAGCYTPSASYQYNSRGATNTICRASGIPGGEWDVTLPSMQRDPIEADKGGDIQVTAYGTGTERCKVRSWFPSGNNIVARVACALNGAPADTRFTLSFMRSPGELAIHVAEDKQEAFYVWANAAPNPSEFYQSDSYGSGGATLESPATGLPIGSYRVHLPGVDNLGSTAHATAYGSGTTYCNIASWGADAAINGTVVNVRCWDGGQAANSLFTLFYNTDQIILF